MERKKLIAYLIVPGILWIILFLYFKNKNKSTSSTKSALTSDDSGVNLLTTSEKRYYSENTLTSIPSGQQWVRVTNITEKSARIDVGDGIYQELKGNDTNLNVYYIEPYKQNKTTPEVKVDSTGTKVLIEYSK